RRSRPELRPDWTKHRRSFLWPGRNSSPGPESPPGSESDAAEAMCSRSVHPACPSVHAHPPHARPRRAKLCAAGCCPARAAPCSAQRRFAARSARPSCRCRRASFRRTTQPRACRAPCRSTASHPTEQSSPAVRRSLEPEWPSSVPELRPSSADPAPLPSCRGLATCPPRLPEQPPNHLCRFPCRYRYRRTPKRTPKQRCRVRARRCSRAAVSCLPLIPLIGPTPRTHIRNVERFVHSFANEKRRPRSRRSPRSSSLDLSPELGAEGAFERRDDAVSKLGGVRVGEGSLRRLEGGREGDRLLPRADLLAAVDVEGAQLTQLGAGSVLCGADQLPRAHVLGNDEGEVLTNGWIGDDVLVDDEIRDTFDELVDVELERAPLPWQLGITQGDDPALAGARPPAGRRQVVRRMEARFHPERCVEPFDSAFHKREASLCDTANTPALLGKLFIARQVDVGLLEERDLVVARVDVAQGGDKQAFDQRRAQNGLLARERLLQCDGAG